MLNLKEHILNIAQEAEEGVLLSPKEFLHLASRDAVDQAFSRLVKEGELYRVGRGLYAAPVHSKFGTRPPSSAAIVKFLTETQGEIIVPTGASAANVLGLTTQMPMVEVYLTSGPSRNLTLGRRTVEFRNASWEYLALGNKLSGQVIRALMSQGEEFAPKGLQKLTSRLEAKDWQEMLSIRSMLPDWLAKLLSRSSEVQYA